MIVALGLSLSGFYITMTGIFSLQSFDINKAITELPYDIQAVLKFDYHIRVVQISFAFITLSFFVFVWLYLALRNLVSIDREMPKSMKNTLIIYKRLLIGIVSALKMLNELWQRSIPDSYIKKTNDWIVPLAWGLLIAANVCKIVAAIIYTNTVSLEKWVLASYWMLAAYIFYIGLFISIWFLARYISYFQQIKWKQKARSFA